MIVVVRSVPVLAEASTVLAGMSRMPFRRFVLLSVLANGGYRWGMPRLACTLPSARLFSTPLVSRSCFLSWQWSSAGTNQTMPLQRVTNTLWSPINFHKLSDVTEEQKPIE
jgi:hypothetical protein